LIKKINKNNNQKKISKMESALVRPVSMMALLTFGVSTIVVSGRSYFIMKDKMSLRKLREMQPLDFPGYFSF